MARRTYTPIWVTNTFCQVTVRTGGENRATDAPTTKKDFALTHRRTLSNIALTRNAVQPNQLRYFAASEETSLPSKRSLVPEKSLLRVSGAYQQSFRNANRPRMTPATAIASPGRQFRARSRNSRVWARSVRE